MPAVNIRTRKEKEFLKRRRSLLLQNIRANQINISSRNLHSSSAFFSCAVLLLRPLSFRCDNILYLHDQRISFMPLPLLMRRTPFSSRPQAPPRPPISRLFCGLPVCKPSAIYGLYENSCQKRNSPILVDAGPHDSQGLEAFPKICWVSFYKWAAPKWNISRLLK